jgi:SnoaL-like protein
MPDLETRLRRVEDRAELQDLAVRYFLAADDDDHLALADTFLPDAHFIAGGFHGGSTREEIVDFIRADRKNMGVTIHTLNFCLFTFESSDRANGVIGAHLELARAGLSLYGAVRYHDCYTRLDDRWRIQGREMLAIHIGPWEDVGTSLTSHKPVRWPGAPPRESDFPHR